MSVKKALVTGGAGFMGSHLVDRLIIKGWTVRIIDNFSSGRMENIEHHKGNPRVEVLEGDLKNPEDARRAVKDVDAVFHYAANPEVRVSTVNPEIHFNENVVATFNFLEAMRRNDVRELVFASSSSVYGEPEEIPVDESAPVKPVSVYGASKAACENIIYAYSKLYGIRSIILRYANVVGPRMRHGVIYDFIVKFSRNPQELEILGDGSQVRSFIYVDDAIEATLVAYSNSTSQFEVYNVASEDWISIREVADIVVEVLGLKNVRYIFKPVGHGIGWPGDVRKISLAIDRIKELGFRPKYSSREAVNITVKVLRNELSQA